MRKVQMDIAKSGGKVKVRRCCSIVSDSYEWSDDCGFFVLEKNDSSIDCVVLIFFQIIDFQCYFNTFKLFYY